MNGAHMIIMILALVSFLLGMVDHPRVNSNRCIALGLFLLTLAQLAGH